MSKEIAVLPSIETIESIITDHPLTSDQKKALFSVKSYILEMFAGKGEVLVEMNNNTFKSLQNNFSENAKLKTEIELLRKPKTFIQKLKELFKK